MDAEEEPAALSVEEGAAGLHPGNNLSGSLLDLQDAAFVAVYDSLYVVYRQFFHGIELIV